MKPALRWPLAIIGLIGLNMVIVGITIFHASSDPSAAVEPDYYQKAVDWDASARLRDASARLGWSARINFAEPGRLSLVILDQAGAPVRDAAITLTAFADARAADRHVLGPVESAPGVYSACFDPDRPGSWQFRVDAARGSDRFLWSGQRMLPLSSLPSPDAGNTP